MNNTIEKEKENIIDKDKPIKYWFFSLFDENMNMIMLNIRNNINSNKNKLKQLLHRYILKYINPKIICGIDDIIIKKWIFFIFSFSDNEVFVVLSFILNNNI